MKRKFLMFFLVLSLTFMKVKALDLTSYSESAILLEPTTKTIIYEVNKDERRPPASMTKIMTMLLIMENIDNGKIGLHDKVTISKNAAGMGGSQVFLQENMQIEVEQLIKGIAIASGNDAAVAMAEYIAGSTDEFVNMMNKKVSELGLKNTNFANVHGLDQENHYSSAYDMAVIAMELLKHEQILNYTSLYEEYLEKPDGTKSWLVNTNKLVRFYEGVDGLKTGFTSTAKYCLTATAKKNGIRFLTVVMGVDTSEHRSADTTSMLNYAFANYKLNKIIEKGQNITEVKINRGQQDKIIAMANEEVYELIKGNDNRNYSYKINLEEIKAPISNGEVVGNLEIINNEGNVVKKIDLVSTQEVKKDNFFSLYKEFFKKILNGFM
ncbi:MAG TPA: D-alanyl-D-alanine carboxypeptidase [Firmicutes bacterium]|nr:D-alanyl-D-alanine carboxypeptidase [Bacillota bacterium]